MKKKRRENEWQSVIESELKSCVSWDEKGVNERPVSSPQPGLTAAAAAQSTAGQAGEVRWGGGGVARRSEQGVALFIHSTQGMQDSEKKQLYF